MWLIVLLANENIAKRLWHSCGICKLAFLMQWLEKILLIINDNVQNVSIQNGASFANFCPSTHKFYNSESSVRMFLIGTCQNSEAGEKNHTAGDQKSLTHYQSVLTNLIIRMMCNLQFSEVWQWLTGLLMRGQCDKSNYTSVSSGSNELNIN